MGLRGRSAAAAASLDAGSRSGSLMHLAGPNPAPTTENRFGSRLGGGVAPVELPVELGGFCGERPVCDNFS